MTKLRIPEFMFGLVETGSLGTVTARKSSQQSRLCTQCE